MKIFGIELTIEEINKIAKNQFTSFEPLVLNNLSSKLKKKAAILYTIAQELEEDREYTEKEINKILKPIYPDYATIRRDLYEAHFIDREKDGSKYRLSNYYK